MRPFVLTLAVLFLAGCAGPAPSAPSPAVPPAPDLTSAGTVLTYEVVAGEQTYPFVASVTENGDEGIAFGYDIANGAQAGTVRITPEAQEAAPRGMLNQFGSDDYVLTDQTSVWMARDDVRRMKAGETVAINLGLGARSLALDACEVPFTVGDETVQTCRYAGQGTTVVALDDVEDPLIVDMNTGLFRVTLQSVSRR